jgi:thiol-disulfide isomerase/thioredoxin
MKKLSLLFLLLITYTIYAQTTLTEAVDFHVKTIEGETIYLFPLLDTNQQIVVIDFFSTSCGPCQDYAPDFQACYEKFGSNQGNVYFMGINWGNDNTGVREFDSIFGLTFPSVSGSQGGGNLVYGDYGILSYPTIIVITPDHQIVEQYIWVPDEDNITQAVINAGGVIVGVNQNKISSSADIQVYPLPCSDFLSVSMNLDSGSSITCELFDLAGSKVSEEHVHFGSPGANTFKINVSFLPNGVYLLKVFDDHGWFTTKKVSVTN